MSRARYTYKNVRNVSPHFKLAVFDEAIRREVTMADVIGSLLAERFNERYILSGEKSIGADMNGDQFRIRIPTSLALKIWRESRKSGETESSVVLSTLAEHFGLIHEPVKKGRKRATAA